MNVQVAHSTHVHSDTNIVDNSVLPLLTSVYCRVTLVGDAIYLLPDARPSLSAVLSVSYNGNSFEHGTYKSL